MRSTLEAIDGTFEHAVFTTYSVNLHFFEQWVMPLLRKAQVRNIVVLADHRELGQALADKAVSGAGRSYNAVSVRLGPGAFHPKVMLLTGETGNRLCISSANLTVDGQLRNLEDAIVLDSSVADHLTAISEAADFVRRLGAIVPAPAADAILAALGPVESPASAESTIRFVHNLDRPLIEEFPNGAFTAVTPFADDGRAARALEGRGSVTVVTDGERFAAPESFFQGGWQVRPRSFGRRLHAKAYWTDTPEGGWLLVGSPNLSDAALLSTANAANTEVAIVLTPHTPRIPDVPGTEWAGDDLAEVSPRRHHAEKTESSSRSRPPAFNAWEDDEAIRVEGPPDGCTVEHWDGMRWLPFGVVVGGSAVGSPAERPYLIRAEIAPGVWSEAVVHRTLQLRRQRLRPRTSSRGADAVTRLPLDIEGVKALEAVITDLYALAELKNREGVRLSPTPQPGEADDPTSLTGWMPARPGDEPRVPQIYREAWQGEPDALLALIRSALRLDPQSEEEDVLLPEESLDLETQETEPDPAPLPVDVPKVQQPVLTRYRNSLVRLLERGDRFVRIAESPELADLGFQAVMRLHERLTTLRVEVDGEETALVMADVLRSHKLELISAYLLDRRGADRQCLATARVHLADLLDSGVKWEPLDRERLESLAYEVSPIVLGSSDFLQEAADGAGIDARAATARLRPFADRTEWEGWFVEADRILDDVDFGDEPFPWVSGSDWFDDLESSPVWRIAGYAAIVGFASGLRYAVVVRNEMNKSNHAAHMVLVDPVKRVLTEAMRRRKDGAWLARTYRPVGRGDLNRVYRMNGEALSEAERSSFELVREPSVILEMAALASASAKTI